MPRLIKVGDIYRKFDFENNRSNQDIIKEAYLTLIHKHNKRN